MFAIKGARNNCGAELTPIQPQLTLHSEKLLQRKNADKKTTTRKRVKPQYGESLTSDEVAHRLHEEEEAHRRPSTRLHLHHRETKAKWMKVS